MEATKTVQTHIYTKVEVHVESKTRCKQKKKKWIENKQTTGKMQPLK